MNEVGSEVAVQFSVFDSDDTMPLPNILNCAATRPDAERVISSEHDACLTAVLNPYWPPHAVTCSCLLLLTSFSSVDVEARRWLTSSYSWDCIDYRLGLVTLRMKLPEGLGL